MANELTNNDQMAMASQPNVFGRIAEEFQRQAARIEALATDLATARGDIAAAGSAQAATDTELKQLVERLAALDDYARKGLLAASEGLVSQYINSNQAKNDAARALANSEAAGTRYDELAAELRTLRESTDSAMVAARVDIQGLGKRIDGCETREAVAAFAIAFGAAVGSIEKRLDAIELKLSVDPPAPPVDPPPIVVEEGPLVVRDETAVIDLGGKTVTGLMVEPYRVRSLTVRNGRIVRAAGTDAYAVDLRRMMDGGTATIENLEIEAGGVDSSCVYAPAIAKLTLRKVYARCRQTGTKDRHARPANVHCDATAYVAEDCFLDGGNSGVYSRNDTSITRRCVIVVEQFATNGYALSSGQHSDCVWVPRGSGRGVLFERGINGLRNCYGLAYDRPNQEFGRDLDGPCVRIRYDGTAEIIGGQFVSVGGGPFCNATALFMSNGSGRDCFVREASFAAYKLGGDRRARAISLESQGTAERPATDEIRDCRFAANQYLLSTTGSDNESGCQQVKPLRGCVWNWSEPSELATFFALARCKLAQIGADPRALVAINAIAADLLAIPAGMFAPRKTWLTGVYAGGDGAEWCYLAGNSGTATWTADDISPSTRGGVRKLVIDGVDVFAPGSEQ